jgi:mRNA-degrading endonuclease toxin of MazEF toxin-antitoxin module
MQNGDVVIPAQLRKAMADQVATVSKRRLVKQGGRLSAADMEAVGHAIMVQLHLETTG